MTINYYFDEEAFEYEPSDAEELRARRTLAALESEDAWDIPEDVVAEWLYEECRDAAMDQWQDAREYERDPYRFYGVSRTEFY